MSMKRLYIGAILCSVLASASSVVNVCPKNCNNKGTCFEGGNCDCYPGKLIANKVT